ncbi:hypothetical protein [Pseudomonas brassicacearum]|uniref:hypothetical protein n=1 Tax=Pseudomonas brassicacearum TaxID=930166 RepID=UPI003992969E
MGLLVEGIDLFQRSEIHLGILAHQARGVLRQRQQLDLVIQQLLKVVVVVGRDDQPGKPTLLQVNLLGVISHHADAVLLGILEIVDGDTFTVSHLVEPARHPVYLTDPFEQLLAGRGAVQGENQHVRLVQRLFVGPGPRV